MHEAIAHGTDQLAQGARLGAVPPPACGRIGAMSTPLTSPSWPGSPAPLGAFYDGAGTNVAVWSDGADAVELCIFDDDGRESRVSLLERTHGVWHCYLPGDDLTFGTRYGFRVHGPWFPEIGRRFNASKLLLDPYARAVDGELQRDRRWPEDRTPHVRDNRDTAAWVPKSVVVDERFDWGADTAPAIPWCDTVIYELHVKGFTARHPGIPRELRGTYAGLGHPAAIGHLVDLGITTVELLPVHAFVSEGHLAAKGLTNFWGYNSVGFFAPHGAYSASGTRGGQVSEFKAMVAALHAAGIEVVLDVVYNHTGESGLDSATLSLRGLDNEAYYHHRGGAYADYTGCGNTLNVAQPAALRMVMDSLRYWTTQMHVDGFRFDLATSLTRGRDGNVDLEGAFLAAIDQDPVLRATKLIAEPWDLGHDGYRVGGFPAPWTEWNDRFRDGVREFWRGGASGVRELAYRLSGSSDIFGGVRRPDASINFVTAHDGFTLRDLVSYEHKHNDDNGEQGRDGTDNNRSWNGGIEGETTAPDLRQLRLRQQRNFLTTLLMSAGTPMLTAGDEMSRTQRGNNNAYCQDNEISWVDWDLDDDARELLHFTRSLVALRREHASLRQQHFEGRPVEDAAIKDLAWFAGDGSELEGAGWFDPARVTLGMRVAGNPLRYRGSKGDVRADATFLVVVHGGPDPALVTLPPTGYTLAADDLWHLVVDTGTPTESSGPLAPGKSIELLGRSVVVLAAQ